MKKRIQSLDEFINEAQLNELKVLSPKNIKEFGFNKKSVNDLKKWSYTIKDINFKYQDFEYWGRSTFQEFLIGKRINIWDNIIISANEKLSFVISIRIHNGLVFGIDPGYFNFEIDKNTFDLYIGQEEDKIKGFINLLDFLFKKFKNDIYTGTNEKLNLETLYVIKAGNISPATGKTGHGWSIYDNSRETAMLGVSNGRQCLYNATGMNVGDKFKILDDQTHKLLFKEFEIVELVPCTYKDFVALSKRRGAKIPIGAFQKQPGDFQFELYSIK